MQRMFDCDRGPLRRMDPSQLHVRICSMNMAHNPAPPESELATWLHSGKHGDVVPDLVVVGVQDAMKTGPR